MRSNEREDGQAIVLVVLAMGIFLVGAVGLGFDGSMLYGQLRKAQLAADASAQAAMLSIFDGTNTVSSNAAKFSTGSSFNCTTSDARTPCKYASLDGFGTTASDTVTVDFPTTAPGVTLSGAYPTNLVKVTITRNVSATFMRLLGATTTPVVATATAAIVDVNAPVPILVTHPSLTQALRMQGTPLIKICGGPSRSIQVNSSDSDAADTGGSASMDLSKAGPLDTAGTCTTGTGADLGTWGGPATSPNVSYGTTGKYVQPASWMQDPLRNVSAPPLPTNTGAMGTYTALADGVSGCPPSPGKACRLYNPGLYTGGIDGKLSTPVFKPGIYYIQSDKGFDCSANCDLYMATGFTDTGANTTGTGWTGNALFYNTGPAATPTNAGAFNLSANGTINLVGSPAGSIYKGILFFQDHNSVAQTHTLGGGGTMTLTGTIYLTNTRATMTATPSQYQFLKLQGGSGSGTHLDGEIIVGVLQLGGNGTITMNLNSNTSYTVSEVALVQ